MKIEKAIKVLDHLVTSGGIAPSEHTRDEAIRLGIEALQRVKWTRDGRLQSPHELLPRETKE